MPYFYGKIHPTRFRRPWNEEQADKPSRPHDEIARLAYSYWEARGRQNGFAEEDWYRAEAEWDAANGR